jgi:hypothetical protein
VAQRGGGKHDPVTSPSSHALLTLAALTPFQTITAGLSFCQVSGPLASPGARGARRGRSGSVPALNEKALASTLRKEVRTHQFGIIVNIMVLVVIRIMMEIEEPAEC